MPLDVAATDYFELSEGYKPFTNLITNGLGAGPDVPFALGHGVLELLQRDGNGLLFRALDQGVMLDSRRHRAGERRDAGPAGGSRNPRAAEIRHRPVRPDQPLRRRIRPDPAARTGADRPVGLRRGLRPGPRAGLAQGAAGVPGRARAQGLRPRAPRHRRTGDAAGLYQRVHPEGAAEPRPRGEPRAPGDARMDRDARRRPARRTGRHRLFRAQHQALRGPALDPGRRRPCPGQDRLRPAGGGRVRHALRRLLARLAAASASSRRSCRGSRSRP